MTWIVPPRIWKSAGEMTGLSEPSRRWPRAPAAETWVGIAKLGEATRPKGQALFSGVEHTTVRRGQLAPSIDRDPKSPERLYKYLPRRFAEPLRREGCLLFRNLAFFRKVEHQARGDLTEGSHIDKPDNPVTLENLSTGKVTKGRFAFHNFIAWERVFAFCVSRVLCRRLFGEFETDVCVEIFDVPRFLLRSRSAVRRSGILAKSGLLAGDVKYYAENRSAGFGIKDPMQLPFAKNQRFSYQAEYRLVCALKGGLVLHQRIVNELFNPAEEIQNARGQSFPLRIGNVSSFTKIISREDVLD